MSGRQVAWTTVAATALGCTVMAASAAWVLLTQPLAVTSALETHALGALLQTLMTAVVEAAAALLRLL